MQIIYQNISDLKPYAKNARVHTKKQVNQIAESIKQFGFNIPILIDENGVIIAGHGRLMASKQLGMNKVPTISIGHLSEAQKRAFIIADNKLTENADWDPKLLAIEFQELGVLNLDFSLDITGFSTNEIDLLIENNLKIETDESLDEVPEIGDRAISKLGDIWQLGKHRLICGDSLSADTYNLLLQGRKAQMIITDPPYNVKIDGHVSGLGKAKHDEFKMASGEMSEAEFTGFLSKVFGNLIVNSQDGSIHYVFMDWRHMYEILSAGKANYTEFKNLCVWNKPSGKMGTFYRSKHELVFVFKNGKSPHINNFQLGQYGRCRTNVWDYQSATAFSNEENPDGKSDFELHPTVKPVSMIIDAIRDCSKPGGIILDPFIGSGSSIIAAEKSDRRCYGIEIEPKYVDVTIARWQQVTGQKAINLNTNLTFNNKGDKYERV